MTTAAEAHEQAHDQKPATVTVEVNGNAVDIHAKKVTGAEIKDAAIKAGVQIAQDFALFVIRGQGDLEPVGDNEEITVHDGLRFRAVAPDDNS